MSSTRRHFIGAITAASYGRIMGANDRVGVGFIGFGLIGAQHVFDFKNQKDADLVALSEVFQPRMEEGLAAMGGKPAAYKDFRRLLDDKNVQAVVVSTPDHWHALMSIMACAAGKDVYVEKPMTLFIKEGRWMTEAARRYNRVVQVGTQQRSGKHYQKALGLIREGYIGKVHSVRMASFRNVMPGFGRPKADLPQELDYEMWLGPAPRRSYSPHRSLYHFRWFWDHSGGQMTNLGAHQIDIAQWYLDVTGPKTAYSTGGRFALEDDGETTDTQDVLYEYPGFTTTWSHREASVGTRAGAGLEFYGTKGSLSISRSGYQVHADPHTPPDNAIPRFRGGQPQGGPQRIEVKPEPWTKPVSEPGSSPQQFDLHVRNFIDCVKSRQRPIADVEDGHFTAVACHLANISLHLGRKVHWDAETEQIIGDAEASAQLERPYRRPWENVLKSLKL